MKHDEIYIGKKVWIKPNPLDQDLYPEGTEYWETVVTYVGKKNFQVKELVRADYTRYSLETLTEVNTTKYKAHILPSLEGAVAFDKKEQLIIKIRKYFNSRAAYDEQDEKLKQVIELLEL